MGSEYHGARAGALGTVWYGRTNSSRIRCPSLVRSCVVYQLHGELIADLAFSVYRALGRGVAPNRDASVPWLRTGERLSIGDEVASIRSGDIRGGKMTKALYWNSGFALDQVFDDPELAFNRGRALLATGCAVVVTDGDTGFYVWSKVVEVDPDSPED